MKLLPLLLMLSGCAQAPPARQDAQQKMREKQGQRQTYE